MTDKRTQPNKVDQDDRTVDSDLGKSDLDERKKVGKPEQPPAPKNVGDDAPNPLPDDPIDQGRGGGGDPGRT